MFALTNDRTRAKRIREGKGKAVLLYVGFDQKLALVEKDRRWNVHICGPCSYQESSPRYIYVYISIYKNWVKSKIQTTLKSSGSWYFVSAFEQTQNPE